MAASSAGFERTIQPFFDQHCANCHDDQTQEGDFSIDALTTKFDERLNPRSSARS